MGSRNAKFVHVQAKQQAIISTLLSFISALCTNKEVFNDRIEALCHHEKLLHLLQQMK